MFYNIFLDLSYIDTQNIDYNYHLLQIVKNNLNSTNTLNNSLPLPGSNLHYFVEKNYLCYNYSKNSFNSGIYMGGNFHYYQNHHL